MCVDCLLCCPAATQRQPRQHGGTTYKYQRRFYNKSDCPSEVRIREDKALIPLEFKGRHHRDSHKAAAVSRITEHQKQALTTIVRTNPLCRAKSARRATQNMDDKFHGWWVPNPSGNEEQSQEECPWNSEGVLFRVGWHANERKIPRFGTIRNSAQYWKGCSSSQWFADRYWLAWCFGFKLLLQIRFGSAYGFFNSTQFIQLV